MIKCPPNLTATKYPGYFWDVNRQCLYSIKVGGTLRPLPLNDRNRWCGEPHFRVSHKGVPRTMKLSQLKRLNLVDSEIPYGS